MLENQPQGGSGVQAMALIIFPMNLIPETVLALDHDCRTSEGVAEVRNQNSLTVLATVPSVGMAGQKSRP